MPKKKVEEIVQELSQPIAERLNYELVDVEYKKEGSNWFLRIYIDKSGGITIDDCQLFSEQISDILDEVDPVPHSYYLEVSSPGLDRPLTKESDYEKYKGFKVDVKLYKPFNGIKQFTGELIGHEGDSILINTDNETLKFKEDDIAIIRLAVEF